MNPALTAAAIGVSGSVIVRVLRLDRPGLPVWEPVRRPDEVL
jgi:hypothetical protein